MAEGKGIRRVTDFISCRQVLNMMVITGFMLNYALRVNLTIAIVEMVEPLNNTDKCTNDMRLSKSGTETALQLNETTNLPFINTTDHHSGSIAAIPLHEHDHHIVIDVPSKPQKRFDWDISKQNLIHGSFFWGYILTELPGGRLAEMIGGRRVFGHSMLWASVLTLFTPAAAFLDYRFIVFLRAVLGFMLGASWPAIHPMTAVWIAPMDRSKFMANMMASSLGAAITMPICGFLISILGWESVFYFTGGIGLAWSILWFFVVYETPAKHPRISLEERREIEEAIGSSTAKKKPSYVPWKDIFLAPCVWAIIITHGCSVFGYFTIVNQLPTYMKSILHYNIKENGLLSSLPYLGKYIMAVLASALADSLRRSGKLSTTATRKIFTTFAVATPGLLMIAQTIFGYDRMWSVTIFTLQLFLNGAVTAGYLGNGLDIAPNFSGTIFGMANTLSSLGGFLSSYMVGVITFNECSPSTFDQWQIVFGILAIVYLVGSMAFLFMGTGELQPWNNPPELNTIKKDNEEGLPLKKNKPITAK